MGKIVQHHQNISNPLIDQYKVVVFFQSLVPDQSINVVQEQQIQSGNVEKIVFKDVQEEISSSPESQFFTFVQFN